jgi:hypothetical protein
MNSIRSLFRYSLIAALVLTPAAAWAQPPAETFSDLPRVLDVGRKVVVTDTDGRKAKGNVVEITPTTMTLLTRDEWGMERRQVFADSGISAINRTDSVWNGLLIGLGAGIVGAELFVRNVCGPRGYDDECSAIATGVGVVTFIPGGLVVGGLIDKFTGNDLLYRAMPRRARMTIAPAVGPRSGGVTFSLSF